MTEPKFTLDIPVGIEAAILAAEQQKLADLPAAEKERRAEDAQLRCAVSWLPNNANMNTLFEPVGDYLGGVIFSHLKNRRSPC